MVKQGMLIQLTWLLVQILFGALISPGFNQIIGGSKWGNMAMAIDEDEDSSMTALLPFGSASRIGSFVRLPQCGGPHSTSVSDEQIGVCYEQSGNNLPSPTDVVAIFKQNNIRKMRLYDFDSVCLESLRGSNIELMLGLPNFSLERFALIPKYAETWVENKILNYSNVEIKYIVVGNAIDPSEPNAAYVLPAMQSMQQAVFYHGLGDRIKVSTAIETTRVLLGSPFPPSNGSFTDEALSLLNPIISFLNDSRSPLLVNLYPYFTYGRDPNVVSLDYALFTAPSAVVIDGQFHYRNLFDVILDAVYAALEKADGQNLEVVISETGWPSAKDIAASVDNARTYNNHLIQHIKGGTPKHPGRPIQTYIFAMFDEKQKSPETPGHHFGLFSSINKQLKYPVNFNGEIR